jgi:hypothetical protein
MKKELYSRRQTLDLRLAMANALAEYLGTLHFKAGSRSFQLARVFDEWPSDLDENVLPAACVLPDEKIVYADARLTPTLLEETWEPKGRPGWGLYQDSDAEVDLLVTVRAASSGERSGIVMRLEDAFLEDRVTGNYELGRRVGRMLPMPAYWGLNARYRAVEMRVIDDAETAQKNWNEVNLLVRAQAPKVRLDRVAPFSLRVTEVVGDDPIP